MFPLIQLPKKSEAAGVSCGVGLNIVSINSTSEEVRRRYGPSRRVQKSCFH